MKNQDFIENIKNLESSILAIDFDGVLHTNQFGFHDGTIYGELIPGSKEALLKLSKNYVIFIHTSKANPKRPLINGKTGVELIWDWLEANGLDKYIKGITYDKINAAYYIDDKAIRFTSWADTLKEII